MKKWTIECFYVKATYNYLKIENFISKHLYEFNKANIIIGRKLQINDDSLLQMKERPYR